MQQIKFNKSLWTIENINQQKDIYQDNKTTVCTQKWIARHQAFLELFSIKHNNQVNNDFSEPRPFLNQQYSTSLLCDQFSFMILRVFCKYCVGTMQCSK